MSNDNQAARKELTVVATTTRALATDPGGDLLTRSQAAALCGISTSTWIRHVENQLLMAVLNDRGHHLFPKVEVLAIAPKVEEITGKKREQPTTTPLVERAVLLRALQLFDEKKNLIDVALELALLPEELEPIFNQWVKHRRALYFDGMEMVRLRSTLAARQGDTDRSGLRAQSREEFMRLIWDLVETSNLADTEFRCRHCPPGVIRRATHCATCADDHGRRRRK